MNTTFRILCAIIAGISISTGVFAAEYESAISFPQKGKPGVLRIASGEGDITVTGYNGDEVIITSDSEEIIGESDPDDERARGLRRISSASFSITTDEEENAIVINRSMQNETDLEIRVPRKTSLYIGGSSNVLRNLGISLREAERSQRRAEDTRRDTETSRRESTGSAAVVGTNPSIVVAPSPDADLLSSFGFFGGSTIGGDIVISDISGDIEVSTIEGDIVITGVTGSIVASSTDGDIEAELVQLAGDKPISFSTVDGLIDVTMPRDIKADVQLKSTDGDIYTNYEIKMSPVQPAQNEIGLVVDGTSFFTSVGIGNSIYGTINGGGRSLTLKTVDGNIYFSHP